MSALPPPASVNPVQVGGDRASPSLGAALTIGEALTLEQEPLEPPRGIPGKVEHDLAGIIHLYTRLYKLSDLVVYELTYAIFVYNRNLLFFSRNRVYSCLIDTHATEFSESLHLV